MLSGLTGLSPGVKLCHLLSACMDSEMPEEVTLIKERQREINMIYGIVEREGPIHKLKRQGLLVVGCCHARNYMKSAML